MSGSSRRRGSTPAPTCRRWTRSTWRSRDGEFVVLVGPSGSGKTTALRMLAGPRGGRLRLRSDRRPRRHRPRAEEAGRGDGLPELRALPVPDGGGEHGLPAQDRARQEVGARAARPRRRRAARADGVPGAQARPALGRPTAAGGDGPRDRARAERVSDGRAALEPRREAARADARRHRRAAGAPRRHDGLRHARPVRGDDARASRRRAAAAGGCSSARAARALRPAREHLRRRVHRLAGDEPLRVPVGANGSVSFGGVSIGCRARRPDGRWPSVVVGLRPESLELAATESPATSRWWRRSAPTRTSSASRRSGASRRSSSRGATLVRFPGRVSASICGRRPPRRISSTRSRRSASSRTSDSLRQL